MATRVVVRRERRKVAALIVAAGEGRRMGTSRAKAFIPLREVPILAYTIQPFEACDRIQSLYPVLRKEDLHSWHGEILDRFPFKKTKPPVVGGLRRQDSVRLGLEAIREDIDTVLIHDGARPLVDISMLEQLLDTMEEVEAAIVGVPAKDTLKTVSSDGTVLNTLPRKSLWHIQTPQAFYYSLIIEAHRKALAENFQASDDAMLVERMGIPVKLVEGSYENIKVTTPEDLALAQIILDSRERHGSMMNLQKLAARGQKSE